MSNPTDDELRAYLKAHAAWSSRYRQCDWEDVHEFETEYGNAIAEELLEARKEVSRLKFELETKIEPKPRSAYRND